MPYPEIGLSESPKPALSTSWVVRESAAELATNRPTSSRLTIRIALMYAMIIQTAHPNTKRVFSFAFRNERPFSAPRAPRPALVFVPLIGQLGSPGGASGA